MELKKWIILFTVMCGACGGGTEVVSVANPNDGIPPPKKFQAPFYEVILDIPEDWNYIEYDEETLAGDEAFDDGDPETTTVASFTHGDVGFFTVFSDQLNTSESLENYIRSRHPSGTITIEEVQSKDGQTGYLSFFDPDQPGPRGGFFFDTYLSLGNDVLWMRTELLGSESVMQSTWEDFWGIVESAQIIRRIK
ncbi:MAG: hypothetical protein Q7T11_03720 [Deltaproteobacteria bacterium]|nr:hypothetical protein [Deltaproteobacteria bacterium]